MDFSYFGPDQTSSSRPFRFWINDDTDSGDYGGNGIPGQGNAADALRETAGVDYRSFVVFAVNGKRDLVDFFPVYLNVGSLVQVLPPNDTVRYVLKQADSAVNFVYTDLTPTNYMNFLRDTNEAHSIVTNTAMIVTADGYVLDNNFVQSIATQGKGILLVEGRANTTQPLVLEVWQGSSFGSNPAFWQPTNMLAQTKLYLSLSGVEQMFRYKNLLLNTPSSDFGLPADRLNDWDVPNEPDTIDKNFVFLHGYNVNPTQARGAAADMFKRMYWSGSHAKFYAVTWEGADTQPLAYGLFTPDYHTNVHNAFLTATMLANFLATLTNDNVVAAHSLGNVVVLSAINDWNAPIDKFFMIDAAVPMETIQGSMAYNPAMLYSTWNPYANRLFASDWWQLFPTNDYRSTLTWSNRLANFRNTDVYNFYSSGEEVLREYDSDPPSAVLSGIWTEIWQYEQNNLPFGVYAWVWQEKGKGTSAADRFIGSSHGGWRFNSSYDTNGAHLSAAQANVLPNSQLRTNAFFDFNSLYGPHPDAALLGVNGSAYAQTNRNRILSDSIPALTLPVGASAVTDLDLRAGAKRNFDMQGELENGWPSTRGPVHVGATAAGEWHHSDFRQVAYTFTYKLFNEMVNNGNLK